MNHPAFSPNPRQALRRFSLYAAGGRIYAQNARLALVDIGSVRQRDDGFCYRVDGDRNVFGQGFAGADDALRDLARHIDAAFLDDQFHSLPDRSEDYGVDLNGASHLGIVLLDGDAEDQSFDPSMLYLRPTGNSYGKTARF